MVSKCDYKNFFLNRHSVRQFDRRMVTVEDMVRVVNLAKKAPSACNRQSAKVYFYSDKGINKELGKVIAGNTGFENDVPNYLVVTSDLSAYYNSFERNQVYVDGGIFALSLVNALHYYGIGSCMLQNGEYIERNKKVKNICGNIPRNEKVILFVAIGYYLDDFSYAISSRKPVNDILIAK